MIDKAIYNIFIVYQSYRKQGSYQRVLAQTENSISCAQLAQIEFFSV